VINRTSTAVVVIGSPEDAVDLQRCTRAFLALRAESVVVIHSALTESERARWGRRLTFCSKVCGCQPGAIAALVAIFMCIFDAPFAMQTLLGTVLASAGLVLAMSIAGKSAAVLAARLVLQIELQRLVRTLTGSAARTAEE
jgi:hypothetical protein